MVFYPSDHSFCFTVLLSIVLSHWILCTFPLFVYNTTQHICCFSFLRSQEHIPRSGSIFYNITLKDSLVFNHMYILYFTVEVSQVVCLINSSMTKHPEILCAYDVRFICIKTLLIHIAKLLLEGF